VASLLNIFASWATPLQVSSAISVTSSV
jgi:hypothetical protein